MEIVNKKQVQDMNGTRTSKGVIPYLKHPSGFEMPVKIKLKGERTSHYSHSRVIPVERKGGYVYALPGGGDYQQ